MPDTTPLVTFHSADRLPGQFSPALLELIRRCIPTLDAAKVLLYVAANRRRSVSADEIAVDMTAAVISSTLVKKYASAFVRCGMLTEEGNRFRFAPTLPEAERLMAELAECYNERPVSLVVTISNIANGRLCS